MPPECSSLNIEMNLGDAVSQSEGQSCNDGFGAVLAEE